MDPEHRACFISPFLAPRILRWFLHFWKKCTSGKGKCNGKFAKFEVFAAVLLAIEVFCDQKSCGRYEDLNIQG